MVKNRLISILIAGLMIIAVFLSVPKSCYQVDNDIVSKETFEQAFDMKTNTHTFERLIAYHSALLNMTIFELKNEIGG